MKFHIEIDVECDTQEEAEEWAERRLIEIAGFRVTPDTDGPLVTPNDHTSTDPALDSCLQVFMVHDSVIQGFKAWLESRNLELHQIPRFGVPDHYYTRTHSIVPKNLDQLMKGMR